MAGSGNEEDLSEGNELLPVQFGQVGPDLDRVVVVPRQRDGLKLRLFILAGASDAYDPAYDDLKRMAVQFKEWIAEEKKRGSGERPSVGYPLYAAGAGGFWITKLERHATNLCYFCALRHSGEINPARPLPSRPDPAGNFPVAAARSEQWPDAKPRHRSPRGLEVQATQAKQESSSTQTPSE
jgi:hypothetical protein